MSLSRSLPPTNQRRALTVFDAMKAWPTRNVATCAVCSQFTISAVLENISFMLLWTHRIPALSPEGEWWAEVVKNVMVRRRCALGTFA
jgi:hypothetical protein